MTSNQLENIPSTVDALVIGAGFSGLYSLHRLREMGFDAYGIDAGHDVGGVWYWNRYPGARCDIESIDYCYSFSDDLVQEWDWTERYPAQPEILRYINHVADRFKLRDHFQFETRVTSATWDASASRWTVQTDSGATLTTQFLIMATGQLAVPQLPSIPGIPEFRGQTVHTGNWPHEGVDFTSKTVAVVGTGSSGVQVIPQIAKQADQLFVLQRTPHYIMPAENHPLDRTKLSNFKENFQDYREVARNHPGGTHRVIGTESALAVPEEELRAAFNNYWEKGGPDILAAYTDLKTNEDAANRIGTLIHEKIHEIVKDERTAALLCPTGYPFASRRLVLEIGYYDSFNRDNVELVDVASDAISTVTESGVRLNSGREIDVDVLVFATGFDALTGALFDIDIRGEGGTLLRDAWQDGPQTYLGATTSGFPNMFLVAGPGSPSVLSNMLVSIEQHVEWITDHIHWLRTEGFRESAPKPEAQASWTAEVAAAAAPTLFMKGNSWYIGANTPGKPRIFPLYLGGSGVFRERCNAVAASGYPGLRVR